MWPRSLLHAQTASFQGGTYTHPQKKLSSSYWPSEEPRSPTRLNLCTEPRHGQGTTMEGGGSRAQHKRKKEKRGEGIERIDNGPYWHNRMEEYSLSATHFGNRLKASSRPFFVSLLRFPHPPSLNPTNERCQPSLCHTYRHRRQLHNRRG